MRFHLSCLALLTFASDVRGDFLRHVEQPARARNLGTGPTVISPDPTCDTYTCETIPDSSCDGGGFSVNLKSYVAASTSNSGTATFTYRICSPPKGVCVCTDGTQTCSKYNVACDGNSQCKPSGPPGTLLDASCNRPCAVDAFNGLSHYDIILPTRGGTSCMGTLDEITVFCDCEANDVTKCNFGGVDSTVGVIGDGSCYNGDSRVITKCDSTIVQPGQCFLMTISIAGESVHPGLGIATVVSKESTDCNELCLKGPSCKKCVEEPPALEECLTRTLGFWGTHPWVTNNYTPVEVCGTPLGCNGPTQDLAAYCNGSEPRGVSSPSCGFGSRTDVMEGLGSIGLECPKAAKKTCVSHVSMVKQLTAAKLNLAATAELFDGATCGGWSYGGRSIHEWVSYCESLCFKDSALINASGCIGALDEFNNSQDVLPEPGNTPEPFNRPGIDDCGNNSGADSTSFTEAGSDGVWLSPLVVRD